MHIITGDIFLGHNITTSDIPEVPSRLESLLDDFASTDKHSGSKTHKKRTYKNQLNLIDPLLFDDVLALVHSPDYIKTIMALSKERRAFMSEVPLVEDSFQVASYAASASIQAAEYAARGVPSFAVVRPPGHHASSGQSHGFCIFNNIAASATFLKERYGANVVVLDYDLHFGDGSYEILGDKNIPYISCHQEGLFPFRKESFERPHISLPPGTDHETFCKRYLPQLLDWIASFKPDIVAVSAGFDAHINEPANIVGRDLYFCDDTYVEITKGIMDITDNYYFVLEGGYNPDVIRDCFWAVYDTVAAKESESAFPIDPEVKRLLSMSPEQLRKEAGIDDDDESVIDSEFPISDLPHPDDYGHPDDYDHPDDNY